MAKRKIFYSFHFDNDVMRVQLVRNIGSIEGNTPVSPNRWEEIKNSGDKEIKDWIEENMKGKSCVVVLVGEKTADRKWVKYEIKKAWEDGKGVLGIHIHNLKCARNGYSSKGKNPFEQFTFDDGTKLSSKVKCYDPKTNDTYNDIKNNIEGWIDEAINNR
jgi:hypothetical protein